MRSRSSTSVMPLLLRAPPAPSLPVASRHAGRLGKTVLLPLALQVRVVLVRRARPERGIDLVMPLPHPRHDLEQPGDQRHQPLRVPAVRGGALLDDRHQRVRLLPVIPARPAEQQRVVAVRAGPRVGDEPLLRHIQLAPLVPVRGPEEVGRLVLRRHRDVQPLTGPVLLALLIPGLLPQEPLAAVRCRCSGAGTGTARARRR